MAFPSRQGTQALQQCVAITAVTRILGDFSRMMQYRQQQACLRCFARPAPHGPIHHPRRDQTLFTSLHFQKRGKDQSCGSTFKYSKNCFTLFCCTKEGLCWRINCFFVKRVTLYCLYPIPSHTDLHYTLTLSAHLAINQDRWVTPFPSPVVHMNINMCCWHIKAFALSVSLPR